jgi:hypothetical protein
MANAQVKPASVKTEVAVKKEAPLPSIMDLEASAGQGSEYVTARDTKLPILKILYASSEVLDEVVENISQLQSKAISIMKQQEICIKVKTELL